MRWIVAVAALFSLIKASATFNEIASHLRVYEVEGVAMVRIGKAHDGGYVVPEAAITSADVAMGYGISWDTSFEDDIARIYDKPVYGFDCTTPLISSSHPGHLLFRSCIGSYTASWVEDGGVTGDLDSYASFKEHLNMIGAECSQIFLKMDIEGAEYETLPEVLSYASQITGIVVEVHFAQDDQVKLAADLLARLEKDFLLVHVHGNNCCQKMFESVHAKGFVPRVLELTYLNRALASSYWISERQDHPTDLDMANCSEHPEASFIF